MSVGEQSERHEYRTLNGVTYAYDSVETLITELDRRAQMIESLVSISPIIRYSSTEFECHYCKAWHHTRDVTHDDDCVWSQVCRWQGKRLP